MREVLICSICPFLGSDGKESTRNAGYLGLIPGLGRSPQGWHGNPLQYSHLVNAHGQRGLAGCSPRGRKESDTTEQLSTAQHHKSSHHNQVQVTTVTSPMTEMGRQVTA